MVSTSRGFGIAYGACLVLLALSGCSSLKPYPNVHEKNALIHVKTDSGSFFSRTRADLHLHSVNAACATEYLGSLRLDNASVDLGLPVGNTVLLAFVFSRTSGLGSRDSASAIEMMVSPRTGHRYEFEVSYLKNRYGATGLEFAPGRSKGREIEHKRLKDCVGK